MATFRSPDVTLSSQSKMKNATVNKGSAAGLKNSAPGKPAPLAPPSSEEIGRRAYQLWQNDGGNHGNDQHYWFAAERELSQSGGARDDLR